MPFYLLLIILMLALVSTPSTLATETELSSHGDTGKLEWAAGSISLVEESLEAFSSNGTGQSLSDVWDLPPGVLFCNKSSDTTINHSYVSDLMNSVYADKANSDLLRAQTEEHWKITHKIGEPRGTQIYICNFGKYDVPFSVAEYNIVDGILNKHCGDLGGWVLFLEWLLWLGRDATNDDGTFRSACGVTPPEQGRARK